MLTPQSNTFPKVWPKVLPLYQLSTTVLRSKPPPQLRISLNLIGQFLLLLCQRFRIAIYKIFHPGLNHPSSFFFLLLSDASSFRRAEFVFEFLFEAAHHGFGLFVAGFRSPFRTVEILWSRRPWIAVTHFDYG